MIGEVKPEIDMPVGVSFAVLGALGSSHCCGPRTQFKLQAVAVDKEQGAWLDRTKSRCGERSTEAGSCIEVDAIGLNVGSTRCRRRMAVHHESTVPQP